MTASQRPQRPVGQENNGRPGRPARQDRAVGRALHVPRIFGVFVQGRNLDRSLSFYRDVLGLECYWKDDTLALLRSRGDGARTLVIREIGERARHGLGEPGASRIAFRVTDAADLDRAEELLTQHAVHYHRCHDGDAAWLSTRDPDGLRVVLLHADEASLAAAPPPQLYWQE
jgi:catechol 2,3-dioxygenase-like lactoylglutathione lyase family enzyme